MYPNHLKASACGSLAWEQGKGRNFTNFMSHLEKLSIGIQTVLRSPVSESPSHSLKRKIFKHSLSLSCNVS